MKTLRSACPAAILLAFSCTVIPADTIPASGTPENTLTAGVNRGVAGVANFHLVDRNIYRGGQPGVEGLKSLAGLGVKTIVDLRGEDHFPGEQQTAEQLGMRYINVPMTGLTPPTNEQIANLLAVMNAADQGPVFIHCKEGKDRTGAVVAGYRIAHDHWSNDKALQEAKSYGMSPWQHPRQHFILNFQSTGADTLASR